MALSALFGASLVVLGVFVALALFRTRRADAKPVPSRTSALAFFSFLCGLGAVVCLAISTTLSLLLEFDLFHPLEARELQIPLARRIILYSSLGPAIAALAFWIAARGAIKEAQGGLRGVALSRAGLIMAAISGALALNGAEGLTPAQPASGFLGVYVESLAPEELQKRGRPGVRILKVVEGSSAERMGLRPGMILEQIDDQALSSESQFRALLSRKKAGSTITLRYQSGRMTGVTSFRLGTYPQD